MWCVCVCPYSPAVCVRKCCVNQPCDDDDGRSTVSTVPLVHVVARSFLARRSIRGAESLSRKSARGEEGGERRGSPLPFLTKIADESSLALSRRCPLAAFRPALTSRCQAAERKREGGIGEERHGGRAGSGRSIEDVSRRR